MSDNFIHTMEYGGNVVAFFEPDLPPAAVAVESLGREPSGYFWDGVRRWLVAQGAAPEVSADPEAGMFSIQSIAEAVNATLEAMRPYLLDPAKLTALIAEAEAAGHDFDD